VQILFIIGLLLVAVLYFLGIKKPSSLSASSSPSASTPSKVTDNLSLSKILSGGASALGIKTAASGGVGAGASASGTVGGGGLFAGASTGATIGVIAFMAIWTYVAVKKLFGGSPSFTYRGVTYSSIEAWTTAMKEQGKTVVESISVSSLKSPDKR
jgi:hypothetical protein